MGYKKKKKRYKVTIVTRRYWEETYEFGLLALDERRAKKKSIETIKQIFKHNNEDRILIKKKSLTSKPRFKVGTCSEIKPIEILPVNKPEVIETDITASQTVTEKLENKIIIIKRIEKD